jgi:hypothetical protein
MISQLLPSNRWTALRLCGVRVPDPYNQASEGKRISVVPAAAVVRAELPDGAA